jgi:tetratricopeptide (TPR) repeat protein
MLGQLHLQDGEAQQALEYYQQALELPDAGEVKRDIYFNMGIAQQQLGRLAAARSNFRQSLEVDPKFGQAYVAIGDLYVTAVGNCGSFEREDRAVYWLAVDYYERAKSVDPSIANQANQKIGTYRRSFPDQEALFFKNWKAGESYRIDYGCYGWIGETTTIRTP